jgi:hypothetical protein
VELLRQYCDHLRRTGGAQVWYWPNGEPGFRTTNEVPYATWGMAEWLNALIEGLAGIQDMGALFSHVQMSPRWAATPVSDVRVTSRYAASKGYFTYRMQMDTSARRIGLTFCGSGQAAEFRVLLPDGWKAASVTINGQSGEFSALSMDASRYVSFRTSIQGVGSAVITCNK